MLVAFSGERIMPAKVGSPDRGYRLRRRVVFAVASWIGSLSYSLCCSCGQYIGEVGPLARAEFFIVNIVGLMQYATSSN